MAPLIHLGQLPRWRHRGISDEKSAKRRLIEQAAAAFEKESVKPADGVDPAELYEQIGRLKVDLEFLKKSCPVLRLRIAAGSSLAIAA